MRYVFNLLLAGLAAVVPVVGTIWLLTLIYKLLLKVGDEITGKVFQFLNSLRGEEGLLNPWAMNFPGADFVRFLLPVLLLLLVGFALANRPGERILSWFNSMVQRVPILGVIYSTLAQFVDALKGLGGEKKFQGVAYVEYPSPGSRLIGFITGNYYDVQTGRGVTSIFIPTSPNPMTGFVVVVDDDKVFKSAMSLDEASKMILSAGLVAPASFGQDVMGGKVHTTPVQESSPGT